MIELVAVPLLTLLSLTFTTGPLGCFLVWRRMAYFGDTVAHAAILGVALGYALSLHQTITVLCTCIGIAICFNTFRSKRLSSDTALGIIAHGGLAFGLLFLSTIDNKRVSLDSILLGDVLTVTTMDLVTALGINILLIILFAFTWKRLILSTIDQDLARAEGISPHFFQFILTLFIAGAIAVGLKLVGALLISALLIVPAATARQLTSSPEAMAIVAAVIGAVCSVLGILLSIFWDLATGPAIVSVAVSIFICTMMARRLKA